MDKWNKVSIVIQKEISKSQAVRRITGDNKGEESGDNKDSTV